MPIKILVRYGEIALKGGNRRLFEQQLQKNLQAVVKNLGGEVTRMHGRFMVSGPEEQRELLLSRLSRVFGVVSVSPVRESGLDLELIKEEAAEMVKGLSPAVNTFKVKTRRPNKNFPHTSPEVNSLLGAHLQELFPELEVDLSEPSFTLSVEISYERAYLYLERVAGPGGLPVGITGRSLLLLSSGIDSPVAGWLAMKRGLAVEALHFHSFPFTGRRSQEKAVDICRRLTLYGEDINLHMIKVTNIQKALRESTPEELSVILLRRMMYRLAGRLSEERGLQAFVTGESLGQVASQTLESIAVIGKAADKLILRPLLGLDKQEIADTAEKIGTYEISILPYEDCCTLFVPRHPVTRPKLEVVEKFEAGLELEKLVEEAYATLETTTVGRSL